VFGAGGALSVVEAARGLKVLIHRLRRQVCGEDEALLAQFRVHLVAHSMGGLVCRSFLQNDEISSDEDRRLVDKVFTYATPHNGIELAGVNVPAVLGLWDMNNFNRGRMARDLGLPADAARVDSLDGKFDPRRFFCLVGTNHRDYETVTVQATRTGAGWSVRYTLADEQWGEGRGRPAQVGEKEFGIALRSKKGFAAMLRLRV
jgi:hypothetical protein